MLKNGVVWPQELTTPTKSHRIVVGGLQMTAVAGLVEASFIFAASDTSHSLLLTFIALGVSLFSVMIAALWHASYMRRGVVSSTT